jgi:CheY-like chemotaxis protein
MGGTLTIRSVLGEGATFVATLPAADATAKTSQQADPRPESPAGAARRILVIDDEPLIGRMLKAALVRDLVEVAVSPHQALELAGAGTYDVILCDYYMPDMSGLDFYRALLERRPELHDAFIFMTGLHNNAEIDGFAHERKLRLLYKPFSVLELEQCLVTKPAVSVLHPEGPMIID